MDNELRVRIISAVTLGLLVIVVTWLGGIPFKILSIAIMVMIFFEWFRMVQKQSLNNSLWIVGGSVIFLTGILILTEMPWVAIAIVAIGAVVTSILRFRDGEDVWPALGILYAGFFGVAAAGLRESDPMGLSVIVFLFAIIWATDILAYFGGRRFGGPKLAPVISPNKTWSGFLSGLAGGAIAGLATAMILGFGNVIWIAVLAPLLSFFGQMGDLFESALKRRYDVKDSGNLIPGHGGVMDRLDSLVFAAFAAYFIGAISSFLSGTDSAEKSIAIQLLGP